MTFVIDTAAKAAFKKMYGKAHTSNSKDIVNESEPSSLSLAAQTIFADVIPNTGSAAVSALVAVAVNIPLVLDTSSNGKSYKAQLTGSVPAGLVGKTNPLTGTTYSTGQRVGFFIPEYLGSDFRIRLLDGATEVPPLASQDWIFDYYAGIVTSEDNLSLASGNIDGYVYTGALLTATGSNWASDGDEIYNRNIGTVLVRKDLVVQEDGYIARTLGVNGDGYILGPLGVGTNAPYDATNVRTRLFVKNGNVTVEDNGGAYVPAVDIRGSSVSADAEVGILGFGNWQSTTSGKRVAKISGLTSNPYDAESGQMSFHVSDIWGILREGMRLDEAGRLGIGTIAPTSLLHVRSSSSGAALLTLDYDNTAVSIGQVLGRIDWAGNDASGGAAGVRASAQGVYRGTAGATAIDFYTTADSSSALLQVMSLNSDQRVGIGTTTPDAKLHIMWSDASASSSGSAIMTLERAASGYLQFLTPDANENGILFGLTSNNVSGSIIYNNTLAPAGFQIRTGGNNTRMTITSAGLFGFGELTPTAKLHVYSGSSAWGIWGAAAAGQSYMTFRQPSSTSSAGYLGTGGGGAVSELAGTDFALRAENNLMLAAGGNTARLTISPSGNVGVGTTSPADRLVVNNGTDSVDIFVAQENGTQVLALPNGMAAPASAQKVLSSTDTSGNAEWNDVNYLRFMRGYNSFFNHEDFIGYGRRADGGGSLDDGWGIWSAYEAGSGSVGQESSAPEDENHPGVAVLSVTSASDEAAVNTFFSFYGPSTLSQNVIMECIIRFSNINQSSNNWTFKFGLSYGFAAHIDGTDEVSISIDAGSNALRAKIFVNGANTYSNLLGVTVAANTWYKLRITYAGGYVAFSCDGGGAAFLQTFSTTPTLYGMVAAVSYQRTTSTGATYDCYIDYISMLRSGMVR